MAADQVACAFARHNCDHAELFQANYQRTNRTKGSKIMRCYPHCCPHHVTRSFCGTPLYVDVQWRRAGVHTVSTTTVPTVLIYARFRLHQDHGHSVDDLLSHSRIAASIQSEDNPNATWIESAPMVAPPAAAATLEWRFEVNRSARWFYGWESGVAKSHRLREHVLEVVVATPTVGADADVLRVIGVLTSPPFKMISFRRATPTAMSLLAKSSAPTVGAPERERVHVGDATMPFVRDEIQRQRRTRQLQRNQWIQQLIRSDSRRQRSESSSTVVTPRTPDTAAKFQDLATVWTYIHSVALSSVIALAPVMETAFWKHWASASHAESDQHPLRRRRRPPVDHTLSILLQNAADGDVVRGRKRPSPSPLLKISVHTALWLCWDEELAHEWHQLVDDATELVMDARALRMRLESIVVEWAWFRLDAFLAQMDWTLPALVAAMREVPCVDAAVPTVAINDLFESFVAHVRERVVDLERSSCGLSGSGKRRRIVGLDASPVDPLRVDDHNSAFDGHWIATLDDVRVRPLQNAGDTAGPATTSWRVAHLLSFWRQLGALSICFHPETLVLELVSLFRDQDATCPQPVSTLVLDHRCRWLRRFPCGESTLAMAVSGHRFGDYVGKVSASRREFHVNLYAWPTDTPWAACYQVHVTRSTTADVLRVNVSMNRGLIDVAKLGQVNQPLKELETWPLPHRLALVTKWIPCGQLQVDYARDTTRDT